MKHTKGTVKRKIETYSFDGVFGKNMKSKKFREAYEKELARLKKKRKRRIEDSK